MSIKHLLERHSRVPEVVRVESAVGRLLAALPAEEINAPPKEHIMSKFCVSKYILTHTLSISEIVINPLHALFVSIFCLGIDVLLGSVVTFVVMPYHLFMWGVKCISFLPVHVGHPQLFPCEQILKGAIMTSNF